MRFEDLKAGDYIIADGGFTCLKEHSIHQVYSHRHGGLAVGCNGDPHGDTDHMLDGQKDDEGNLVGLKLTVLSELLREFPGDEPWRKFESNLCDFLDWLKDHEVPLPRAWQAVHEAVYITQGNGRNHPDIAIETAGLARRYGFKDDPMGFFAAATTVA